MRNERFGDLCSGTSPERERRNSERKTCKYMRTQPRLAKKQKRLVRQRPRDARTTGPQIKRALEEPCGEKAAQRAVGDCEHATKRRNFTNQPGRSRNAASTDTDSGNENANSRLWSQGRHAVRTRTPGNAEHIAAAAAAGERRAGLGVDSRTSSCPMPTRPSPGSTRPRPEHFAGLESASSTPPPVLVLQSPVHFFLSPGSSSCSTDQTYRPTKPTRGRRERGFLRNLTARAEQGGAEGRRAHSNGEEEEQSPEGEGPEALSFPLYRQCPPLLAHILASATSTPQHLRCSGTPVVIVNADGHSRNPAGKYALRLRD